MIGTTGALAALALAVGLAPIAATAAPTVGPRSPVSVATAPLQSAKVDGATLGYRVAGTGKPLVLIAGSSNTMAEWDPRLLDELARRHRVVIFDNRGAGTSTGSVAHLTIDLMARDTAQLIAQVAGGRADVLGWSMGGFVAQSLAIDYPERVRRLVLASTDCGGNDTAPPRPWALAVLTNPDATPAQRMSVLFPRDRRGAGVAWSAAIGAAYAANDYQPEDAFTVSPETATAQVAAAGPKWLRPGRGTCDRLDRVTQRTLIGAGADDVIVPVRNHRALLRGIPRAEARVYRNAGHAFLFQPGLDYAASVSAFLLR